MQYLSAVEVAALAAKVAKSLRLRIPPQAEVAEMLKRRGGLPQFYSDGTLQLWVDKYYIAHSSIDEPYVHYVYLTDRHIDEERLSFQQARISRKNRVAIPPHIEAQFGKALKAMDAEKNFVIHEKSAVFGSK
ncbi:MAG: hypothetical protein VB051_05275 [Candidatus Pelethousia sp.]|nr:hypothetical protein [Candidatus Pelethousia sp.]